MKIKELDGIRGIAILLVLVCHLSFWEPFYSLQTVLIQGRIGVDLFFVLSGFLITGILLDTKEVDGTKARFYVRRILRIWPLYFAALAVMFLLLKNFLSATSTPWPYIFFSQNLGANHNDGPFLQPFWSLAVEEQFYLIWPWIVLRLSRHTLMRVCVSLFLSAAIIRVVFALSGVSQEVIYVHTLCRTDAIALGSLLAVMTRSHSAPRNWTRFQRYLPAVSAIGFVFCLTVAKDLPLVGLFAYSFVSVFFLWLVANAWQQRGSTTLWATLLRFRGLTYLGEISFGLYVLNFPVYNLCHGRQISAALLRIHSSSLRSFAAVLLSNFVLLLLATASWFFFEKPILSLKERFAPHVKAQPFIAAAHAAAGD